MALAKRGASLPRTPGSPYPTTHFTPAPTQPRVFYKNCAEAHKDGRWNIPADDPAYRPGLDKDHDGIACSSRARRWAGTHLSHDGCGGNQGRTYGV
ncbi:excalibur calcium-binding domain-containing protein [Mycobacterium sp.]|uniref:excalibur calcium-binding domain-containing protein n=1 Tax=Mycobacterium sp. TaxID=1785 RepID=UPI003F7E48AA